MKVGNGDSVVMCPLPFLLKPEVSASVASSADRDRIRKGSVFCFVKSCCNLQVFTVA